MQADSATQAIADRFISARLQAQGLVDFPGTLPATLGAAYAIQDAAIATQDDTIAGWKVGRVAAPLIETFGVGRLVGPAFTNGCQPIGAIGKIFKGGFGAVEAEFMFRLGSAPDPAQRQFTLDQCADLVDAVFVGFEIASSPYVAINDVGPLAIVSDFGNNNGLLVGAQVPDWRGSGLESWTVETVIDGTVVGSGQAASFPDGALGSVKFLLENLAERGIAVAAGTLVSTGAVSGVHQVYGGEHVLSRFGPDMTIECHIEHATPV